MRLASLAFDELETSFRPKLISVVQTVEAFLPVMRERGWGRVVNRSSLIVLGVTGRTVGRGQGFGDQLHAHLVIGGGTKQNHRQRYGARSHRDRTVPRQHVGRQRGRAAPPVAGADAMLRHAS